MLDALSTNYDDTPWVGLDAQDQGPPSGSDFQTHLTHAIQTSQKASLDDAGQANAQNAAQAKDLITSATDPKTGRIDTDTLATQVAGAASQDMHAASAAYAAIHTELQQQDPSAAETFNHQVASAFLRVGSDTLAGSSVGLLKGGSDLLVKNPILVKQWTSTTSAWTGKGGFTPGLQSLLESRGIQVSPNVNPIPPGSVGRSAGVPFNQANNTNGARARDAIAANDRAQGYHVETEVPRPAYNRRVDVVTDVPANDPRYNQVVETESKVGRQGLSPTITAQAEADGRALADNAEVRGVGKGLETVGKVALPLAIAGDAIQLGQAYQQDGDKIGVNTERTASGIAGGWGGAVAGAEGGAAVGAAIGSVVPGLGTAAGGVVGGIVGGIAGGIGGDWAGRQAFDTIRSWF